MKTLPFVLPIALFLAVLSNADSDADPTLWDNCTYTLDAWNHANATSAYPIPGISVTQSHIAPATFNWTIYDTVTRSEDGASTFQNDQLFWLDSSKTTQPATEPLKGCVWALRGLPSDLIKKGQDDTGDCTSMLDADCIDDITTQFAGLSGHVRGESLICLPPVSISLPHCKKYAPKGSDGIFWDGSHSGEIYIGPRPKNENCSAAHALPIPLVPTETGSNGDPSANNFTDYDQEVTLVTPLIMSFFNNFNTTATSFQQTSMYCLRPKNITAGSRVPTEVAGAGSALRVGGWLTTGFVLVAAFLA